MTEQHESLAPFWEEYVERQIGEGWFDFASDFDLDMLDEFQRRTVAATVSKPRP